MDTSLGQQEMASNWERTYIVVQESHEGDEFNPFDVSDDKKIVDIICSTTHDVDDAVETFNCVHLFLVVKNILEHSSQVLDEEIDEDKKPAKEKTRVPTNTNFNLPLPVLKQIACELTSIKNQTGPEASHRTTMRIIKKLQNYSWEAKAVLALLALAVEFRDLSRPLSEIHHQCCSCSANHQEEASQSLAIIVKNVLVFTTSSSSSDDDDVEKFRKRVGDELEILRKCVNTTLQVTESVVKLEKLASVYDKKGHSSQESRKALVVHSYWVTMAIVACATRMTLLTSDVDNKLQDHLENYTKKMHSILDGLTKKLNALNEQAKLYWDLMVVSAAPRNTAEVILAMCKPNTVNPNFHHSPPGTNKWVGINSTMEGKAAFIFISGVNISDADIDLMKEIQKKIDDDKLTKFRLVWSPISEVDWTGEIRSLLNKCRAKMTWYDMAICTSERPLAKRYIEEEWHYKGQTMLIVMNERGIVENSDAYELLRRWRMEAFPFDKKAERRIADRHNWPKTIVSKMNVSELKEWIKDEKRYIFIYGGRDEAWTKKFQETLKSVEHLITRRSETKIICFCVEKTVSSQFWSGVEKWYSDTEDNGKLEREIKQIQTLLSYKNQEGWVLLCKGPRAVMSGHGQTVLEVLEEFKSDWETESVKIDLKSSTFEKVFEEYHTKIINKNGAHCCQLQIEASNGEQVKEKKCTVCSATMKVKIAYECCHEGTPVAAHR